MKRNALLFTVFCDQQRECFSLINRLRHFVYTFVCGKICRQEILCIKVFNRVIIIIEDELCLRHTTLILLPLIVTQGHPGKLRYKTKMLFKGVLVLILFYFYFGRSICLFQCFQTNFLKFIRYVAYIKYIGRLL